ncbi:MAG: hypothetical protein ACLRSW_01665 [Christensenellaceae bacterium]
MKQKFVSVYDNGRLVGEPVVFIEKGGRASAALAHVPEKILRLYNPVSGEELGEEDFYREENTLVLKGGKGKRLKSEWLRAKNLPHGIKHLGGEYGIDNIVDGRGSAGLFSVPRGLYRPARVSETAYFSKALLRCAKRREEVEGIKILLYGDSISTHNSAARRAFRPLKAVVRTCRQECGPFSKTATLPSSATPVRATAANGAENAFEGGGRQLLNRVRYERRLGKSAVREVCGKYRRDFKREENPGCSAILVSSSCRTRQRTLPSVFEKEYGAALRDMKKAAPLWICWP